MLFRSYFKSGNSKIAYKYNATDTAVYWWLRSARYDYSNYFCLVGSDGTASISTGKYSWALAPGFVV